MSFPHFSFPENNSISLSFTYVKFKVEDTTTHRKPESMDPLLLKGEQIRDSFFFLSFFNKLKVILCILLKSQITTDSGKVIEKRELLYSAGENVN